MIGSSFSNLFSTFITVSVQNVLNRISSILNSLISVIILSQYSTESLAASTYVTSSQILISGAILSVFTPLGTMISNAKMIQDDIKIISYVVASSIIALFLSLIIITCLLNLEFVLHFSNQDSKSAEMVGKYVDIFVWSVPLLAISQVLSQFAFGMLKQKFVLLLNIFSTLLFSFVCYVLVLGKLGFSAIGIEGVAVACNIKFGVNCIFLLIPFSIYVHSKSRNQGIKFILDKKMVKEIIVTGFPFMINSFLSSFYIFIINLFTGWLGIKALVINQLSFQFYWMMYSVLDSLAYSCGILLGRVNHKYQQIKQLLFYNLVAAIILVLISITTLHIFLDEFIDFFIRDKKIINFSLIHEIKLTFFYVAIVLILEAIISTLRGGLLGVLDTKSSALICIIFDWLVALPLIYFLIIYTNLGFKAIFLAKAISLIFSSYFLTKKLVLRIIPN